MVELTWWLVRRLLVGYRVVQGTGEPGWVAQVQRSMSWSVMDAFGMGSIRQFSFQGGMMVGVSLLVAAPEPTDGDMVRCPAMASMRTWMPGRTQRW